ncbi:MAG: Hsp20/alpha crystallin family protein [Eubacteriales bacterium]|nr:Hsp20/alpha crystallin family protein [Lachnospiraceae bacterium]MDO5127654.1 Hsp20/alpha crystallin family protein [Eubacteriales bacterium]
MLMPTLFRENLLDDFFEMPGFNGFGRTTHPKYTQCSAMRTDIKEKEDGYDISMNLPGFKKEDVQAELKDGYLTVRASTSSSEDTKDEDGKYICRERYSGTCSRSFYVGEEVTKEDIKAKFEDGVLKLYVPKKEPEPVAIEKQYVEILG